MHRIGERSRWIKSKRFRELEGEGKQGHVTREQAADIAREIASFTTAKAECRDAGLAVRMANEAISRLGPPEQLDSWDKLGDYAGLSPNDFAADIVTDLENESNIVVRDQIRSALTEATTNQIAGKIGVGWGPFMAAVGQTLSGASQEAKASFEDHLNKRRIGARWKGNTLVPKSVDVHTTESIRSAWRGGFSLEYTRLVLATVEHTIPMNNRNWFEDESGPPKAQATAREEIGRLDRAIDALAEGATSRMTTLGQRLETQRRTDRIELRGDIDALEQRIRDLDKELNRTIEKERKKIDTIVGAMMTRAYTIELDGEDAEALESMPHTTRSDLPTEVSSVDYPVAFINNWTYGPECRIRTGPSNPDIVINASAEQVKREWLIVVHDATPGCRTMNVVVTYMKGRIIDSVETFEREGRTSGGTLRMVR